jgi:hypothetical protein
MKRTHTTFSLLQAVAAVATLAVLMWSLGFPSIRFAEAVNVTTYSDTISDSAPSVVSDHTISFVTPTGMVAGETISLTFEGGTGIASLVAQDLDLDVAGVEESLIDGAASGVDWNVTTAGQVIDITSGTDAIGAGATVTIEIGTNATAGGTGTNQITNPTIGAYTIAVDVGSGADTGTTMVAIVDTVTVSAAIDTTFTFTVAGLPGGTSVNGTTTTGSTTATAIPFGTLTAGTPSTTAQQLSVTTNAANGFVVTVQADGGLLSTTGAEVSSFIEGADTSTPTAWASPVPVIGSSNTYGHWGLTTNDESVGVGLADDFGAGTASNKFVAASTTPVEVFRNDGPSNGTAAHSGRTEVGYQIEISTLQEAAEDYSATLTYVATPVF